MPDRSSHQGPPEERDHGSHAARGPFSAPGAQADPYRAAATGALGIRPAATAPFATVTTGPGTARRAAERPATTDPVPGETADAGGFLGALFDFGFTSYVTPSVIKVLYVLIIIGTVVSALVFTIIVFKVSALFGFLMLVFGDPLFVLIVLAIYRVILEFLVVTFRMAEDIRALRERGDPS